MSDEQQAKDKLHALEVRQAELDNQPPLFPELENLHEARKQQNLRKLYRQKNKLKHLEDGHVE